MMRKILLAAVAVAALATPALARDGSPYVGVEGGLLLVEDLDLDASSASPLVRANNGYTVDFKQGVDLDALAGYDFGMFRVEGELGYKRLRTDRLRFDDGLARDLSLPGSFDLHDRGSVLSLMANGLVDFGNDDGLSAYVGAGIGRARVRLLDDSDSTLAWQAIAGVRQAVSPNIDVGLKYRYFRSGRIELDDTFSNPTGTFGIDSSGKMRSHSLLASLIFNFGAPAPAPVIVEPVVAPPAPPPATQTCFDGTVILATDVCPQPPVAAPVPAPERG
jgi:opacity protein-like surface antigen